MANGTGRGVVCFMPRVDLADFKPEERRAAVWALDQYTAGTTVQVHVGDIDPFPSDNWLNDATYRVLEALNELTRGGLQVLLSGTPRALEAWHDALSER